MNLNVFSLGFIMAFSVFSSLGCSQQVGDKKNDIGKDKTVMHADATVDENRDRVASKKVLPRDRLNWSGKPKPSEWGYIPIPKGDEALENKLETVRKRRERAMQGIEYEHLDPLPPPELKRPVPKVKVVEKKASGLPVKDDIYGVFTDENDRLKYLVTKKDIVFIGSDKRVKKRMKIKAAQPVNRSVNFSENGRWVLQNYATPKTVGTSDVKFITEVYDENGNLFWKLHGTVLSLSPNGKRAIIQLPELSGIQYIEKGWKEAKDLWQFGGSQACVFDGGALVVNNGAGTEISVYDENWKKANSRRLKVGCYLVDCLAHVDRALIRCSWFNLRKTILIILDSAGDEIRRIWFPSHGNTIVDFVKRDGLLLAGVSRGEFVVFDVKRGNLYAKTKHLKGLSVDETEKQPLGIHGEYLVRKAILINGAIALFRDRKRSPDMESIKRKRLDIVDLSGKVLFSKEIIVKSIDMMITGWREGNKLIYIDENGANETELIREGE